MYAGHFIFMNQEEYKNTYNDEFQTNAKLLILNDTSIENTQNQSAKFMKLSAVKGVVQNTTLYNQINTIVESLDKIMLVLIIVASMLTVVIFVLKFYVNNKLKNVDMLEALKSVD